MTDQPLRAQFFVIRQNDTMVPLVALDELPSFITIREVPRILAPRDIAGMTCIGSFDTRHLTHSVINMNQPFAAPSVQNNTDNTSVPIAAAQSATPPIVVSLPQEEEKKTTAEVEEGLPTDADLTPEADIPNDGKKRYCTHWMRTGDCNWTGVGCHYWHIMPLDQKTLNRLGFRDIPRWYREEHGLGSLLAVKGAAGGLNREAFASVSASIGAPSSNKPRNNWRTPAPRDSSPSTSDGVVPRYRARGTRGGVGRARATPNTATSKPAPRKSVNLIDMVDTPHRQVPINDRRSAATSPPHGSKNLSGSKYAPQSRKPPTRQYRRVSIASYSSDYEAEVLREDAARKAKEEAEFQEMNKGMTEALKLET